jgi:pimeloyl-ACP methyl ester carboxylesterase
MGERVEINGHPTWVDQRGSGDSTMLIMHGGLSNSDLLEALTDALAEQYRVVAFDRRGHGRTADTDDAFHYDDMATEAIGVLEQVVGGPAHLVGWSDGGIVGLFVAMRRPDLVDRMVLIGANFHFEGAMSVEVSPEFSEMIRADYAARSPDGDEHFDAVFGKFVTMITAEPTLTTDDLRRIGTPTLVLAGDDDLITLAHTAELYESLPAGQLAVVPGTSHTLPIERPDETARIIRHFLDVDVPPLTVMPVRRATPTQPTSVSST